MICDVHVHLAGTGAGGTGNYLAPRFRRSLAFRILQRRMGLPAGTLDAPDCDCRIGQAVVDQLRASRVDHAVVLAFDAAYREDGRRDDARTLMVVDNDFVADLAAAHDRIRFGASIHPYRRDAVAELDRLVERGACLIKWLPSAQNIQPDHSRCRPFYEAMARHGIPLLSHAGAEHTLKAFPNAFSDPRRLAPALACGVTVIAAHCGRRAFLHDPCQLPLWKEMARRHDRFFGDISAFAAMPRIWPLRRLVNTPELERKLVFGSDFPSPALPLTCIGSISIRRALELHRVANPFDRALGVMRAAGVPESVFARAEQWLRLPGRKPPLAPAGSPAGVAVANATGRN